MPIVRVACCTQIHAVDPETSELWYDINAVVHRATLPIWRGREAWVVAVSGRFYIDVIGGLYQWRWGGIGPQVCRLTNRKKKKLEASDQPRWFCAEPA